jgi:hypothetical protein
MDNTAMTIASTDGAFALQTRPTWHEGFISVTGRRENAPPARGAQSKH